MRISSPGRTDSGFASVDALLAVVVVSLALAGIAVWFATSSGLSAKRQVRLTELLQDIGEADTGDWDYGVPAETR